MSSKFVNSTPELETSDPGVDAPGSVSLRSRYSSGAAASGRISPRPGPLDGARRCSRRRVHDLARRLDRQRRPAEHRARTARAAERAAVDRRWLRARAGAAARAGGAVRRRARPAARVHGRRGAVRGRERGLRPGADGARARVDADRPGVRRRSDQPRRSRASSRACSEARSAARHSACSARPSPCRARSVLSPAGR